MDGIRRQVCERRPRDESGDDFSGSGHLQFLKSVIGMLPLSGTRYAIRPIGVGWYSVAWYVNFYYSAGAAAK